MKILYDKTEENLTDKLNAQIEAILGVNGDIPTAAVERALKRLEYCLLHVKGKGIEAERAEMVFDRLHTGQNTMFLW